MLNIMVVPSIISFIFISSQHQSYYDYTRKGRNLLELDEPIIDVNDKEFMIGYSLGWFSAIMDITALPFQIVKNVSD